MRLLGGWLGCVENLIGCRKFGAYFCGVGLQNGGSENPNGEESRRKNQRNMSDLENKINQYLCDIKLYISRNEFLYPTSLCLDQIFQIKVYNASKLLGNGASLKDENTLNGYKEYTGNGNLQIYDILICLSNIQESIKYSNQSLQNEFEFTEDDAIKSIITHEFTHSISIGFLTTQNESFLKDEVYTDFFASEIFRNIFLHNKFYTSYLYNDAFCENYINIQKEISTDNYKVRKLYFRGK